MPLPATSRAAEVESYDEATQRRYFSNWRTGESSWERPKAASGRASSSTEIAAICSSRPWYLSP